MCILGEPYSTADDLPFHSLDKFSERRPSYDLARLQLPSVVKKFSEFHGVDLSRLHGQADQDELDLLWKAFVDRIHVVSNLCLVTRIQAKRNQGLGCTVGNKDHVSFMAFVQQELPQRVVDRTSNYDPLSDYPVAKIGAIAEVGRLRRLYDNRCYERDRLRILKALTDIETTSHVSVRLNHTFKLIRYLKRRDISSGKEVKLKYEALCSVLSAMDSGRVINPYRDCSPLSKPPSYDFFVNIVMNLRSGTSPGPDYLYPEMIKFVPALRHDLYLFVRHSFVYNVFPRQWTDTSIVLLPKIKRPMGYDDYRPITLSSCAYKVYVTILLTELQKFTPEIPDYQSGFLTGRSAEDSIFCLNRVFEEHWNHRQTLFVLSLDLAKAFSSINLHEFPRVLHFYNVPTYLGQS